MAAWQVCDACGAVVANWVAHVAWHKAITPTSTPAPAVPTAPTQSTGSA